ncbi:Putative segregation and condensation protein A [Magnetospirillum gryphiswaldense MSR-1 v2]|uniref:Segregation and condensation protein A n=1 Tax=Magnetospirillum gryphiswaldense (strain DSM 6361 / JCM 21280 / NBRC 15271 / MSR-1) TaxID=431944 RepID=V6EYL6_MAGGM|nr:ScpA family protein [Magnetospirillum gryphiswaldense]CDK98257.1 Putative segregation and condensation protein A [Magnetospirillum gryphiswaldense MSR-1 v2]
MQVDVFQEDEGAPQRSAEDRLVLDLDGFEGPLDVLLALAREQKVDLAKISILKLADQYLEFVHRIRQRHLDLAAEYLVMAAWLAYLKSRLLLPEPEPEQEGELSAAEMADILAFRLRRLEAMQKIGTTLVNRARLGRDIFARGEPENVAVITHSLFDVQLFDLLKAYSDHVVRTSVRTLHIEAPDLYSVEDALRRLEHMLGTMPDWSVLSAYLPAIHGDPLKMKSAVASTFIAALELAKQGRLQLRQDGGAYSPIYVKAGEVAA